MSRVRVMLFVQDGDGRPKCVFSRNGWTYNGDWLNTSPPLPMHILIGVDAADRWWLVECESADAGRLVIKNNMMKPGGPFACGDDPARRNCHGRILASGGRP